MSIQTTDPVADLITRIRNAIAVGKTEIRVPTSKLKFAVADKLQKIHYLEKVEIEEAEPRSILHIIINNEDENARINEITKVSKPGRRIYAGVLGSDFTICTGHYNNSLMQASMASGNTIPLWLARGAFTPLRSRTVKL